jgi:hypothetical protein
VYSEPPKIGKVPPDLNITCIEGNKESISIVVPPELDGQNHVTVSTYEVGKLTLPEFVTFDRSTGTFNILITKASKVGKYHLEVKASDAFGDSTSISFYIELLPG